MKRKVIVAAVLIIAIIAVIIGYKNYKDNEFIEPTNKEVDLIMFMGQSNMSGKGDLDEIPNLTKGAGYEFRAISDPTKLYTLTEPFGATENNTEGIDDEVERTGSLVTAFVNAYYKKTETPVVGVSASAGGSTVHSWSTERELIPDAVSRFETTYNWLIENGYTVKHKYMVWLQGESDATKGTSAEEYQDGLWEIYGQMQNAGVEKCFVIRIGENAATPGAHDVIIGAQNDLCQSSSEFVMISLRAIELYSLGYMQDDVHFNQSGLNLVGEDAGNNMAEYVLTGVEPDLYDPWTDSTYTGYKDTTGDDSAE